MYTEIITDKSAAKQTDCNSSNYISNLHFNSTFSACLVSVHLIRYYTIMQYYYVSWHVVIKCLLPDNTDYQLCNRMLTISRVLESRKVLKNYFLSFFLNSSYNVTELWTKIRSITFLSKMHMQKKAHDCLDTSQVTLKQLK